MKRFLFLLLATFTTSAYAQSGESGVRAAISQLFDGMRQADSISVKAIMAPGARLQTVTKNKQGETVVREDAISGFVQSIGQRKAGELDERLGTYTVNIDGDLATAFTPYTFYFKGQKSHCGANAFTLVRLAGGWKIQNIIDTRRRDCPQ